MENDLFWVGGVVGDDSETTFVDAEVLRVGLSSGDKVELLGGNVRGAATDVAIGLSEATGTEIERDV